MKRFIYYDNDFIESYLAQETDGLILLENTGKSVKDSSLVGTKSTESSLSTGAEVNLKLLKLNATNSDEDIEDIQIDASSETGSQIITKVLHDNAFERFIETNNITVPGVKQHPIEMNNYISIHGDIQIINIDEILQYDSTSFDKVLAYSDENHLQDTGNRQQRRNNKSNKTKYKRDESIDFVFNILKLLKVILPTNIYASYGEYMIPIYEENLRIPSNRLNFKTKKPTILVGSKVGKLADCLQVNPSAGAINDFLSTTSPLKSIALEMFGFNQNSVVVDPIAWYYPFLD